MRSRAPRDREGGVVLVNVLAVVALASAVAVTMLALSQSGIRRSQRFGDAAQALAASMGAETSAIVALRRDAEEAPGVDHAAEAWASVAQERVAIAGGTFSLAIEDAQGRFNVNSLSGGGVAALETFRKIALGQGLQADVADRVHALIRFGGPLADLGELRQAALEDREIAALSSLVTTLPGRADVNINAAGAPLLAVLLGNPVSAAFLVARRDRAGFLTAADLDAADILLPPGVGFTSNYFRVVTDVTIGDTSQRLTSLLHRRKRGGGVEVVAISRQRGRAVPLPEPPAE